MLTKIPLSNLWQQINLASNYKNNRNVRVLIQQTPDNLTEPTGDDGVVIKAYESFKIPADGAQYWAKVLDYESAEIINDPTVIVPVSAGAGGGSLLEGGTSSFAGNGSYVEIVLAGGDPGVTFQAIITALGSEAEVSNVGGITVTYPSADRFRVYNSGLSGINFQWTAVTN